MFTGIINSVVGNLKTDWNAVPKSDAALCDMSFPSLCPGCLGKTNLTSYTLKYRVFVPPKWRKKEISIPICESCKKAAIGKTRKEMAIMFAVWAPVSWGLLLILGFTGILGNIVEALGFPWGLLPPFVLVGTPLYALYFLIRSFLPSKEVGWPITLEEPGTILAFENETYVKKFATANTERLESVVDWAASPPKWLIQQGHTLM